MLLLALDSFSVLKYTVYLYLFPNENCVGVKRLDFKMISLSYILVTFSYIKPLTIGIQ